MQKGGVATDSPTQEESPVGGGGGGGGRGGGGGAAPHSVVSPFAPRRVALRTEASRRTSTKI
ncbi:hypothetical protein EYF80_059223 [Liparis tanakae]|uniref:Uncharacterized protein n=1 Tax=Liparis tanakae TaxID=230148 RepID=A0A4Z2EP02_9TELE|nr:hypothetical protein EYF80_059223 [Liparis tanakae]